MRSHGGYLDPASAILDKAYVLHGMQPTADQLRRVRHLLSLGWNEAAILAQLGTVPQRVPRFFTEKYGDA